MISTHIVLIYNVSTHIKQTRFEIFCQIFEKTLLKPKILPN